MMNDKDTPDMILNFDMDLGVKTLRGVLTLAKSELTVEWRLYNLMDAPIGQLESTRIPYSDLIDLTLHRRFGRRIVEITAKSATAFGSIPLPAGDLTVFRGRVKRRDRSQADAWAAEGSLRIAEELSGDTYLE